MSKLKNLIAGAVQAIEGFSAVLKKIKDGRTLNFRKKPKHEVSRRTIKQLKSILKGRSSILPKQKAVSNKTRKFMDKALRDGTVVWNTPENGLNFIESIYNPKK